MTLILSNAMLCALAQSIAYGHYTGSEKTAIWGTGKAETYSVAMLIDEPSLQGMQITAIRIPVNPDAKNVTDCTAFLTHKLEAKSGKCTGDVANVDFTLSGDTWNTITLPEPVTVTADTLYVGYTFRVTSATDQNDQNPMLLMVASYDEGLQIITSRTYRKWQDISNTLGGSLAVQLEIKGNLSEHSVGVTKTEDIKVAIGQTSTFRARLANYSPVAVENISYTYEVDGQSVSATMPVEISNKAFGCYTDVSLPVPAIQQPGDYQGTLTITHVNGQPNDNKFASAANTVRVMNIVPVKHPLMEEFTGAWCGFCPAGYASMKYMNEKYGEEFICASYHNGDAMQITTAYPVPVDGFPAACFDRFYNVDAYQGDTRKDLGIEITWDNFRHLDTPANVDLIAQLDEKTGQLDIKAQYSFCEDVADANYGVAYIITADGLSGTGGNWLQHNYFSYQYQNGAYSNMYIDGMDQFNNGDEYQFLVYDDVVVAQSGQRGATIEGVIPATCAESSVYEHTYQFNTNDMVNTYGAQENLVQHPDRLHAIAILYDINLQRVVNCNRCLVEVMDMSEDAILSATPGTVTPAQVYNLSGQQLPTQQRGINIVRMSDGSVRKVLVR